MSHQKVEFRTRDREKEVTKKEFRVSTGNKNHNTSVFGQVPSIRQYLADKSMKELNIKNGYEGSPEVRRSA